MSLTNPCVRAYSLAKEKKHKVGWLHCNKAYRMLGWIPAREKKPRVWMATL